MTGFHSKQDMAAGKQEDDPCPGCIVGTVCRTPNCGRLKLPVDHPFRNTKAALIASIIACRDMLDAQPVPAREPVKCLDCGSHNVGIPATYDSLINSVKALNT